MKQYQITTLEDLQKPVEYLINQWTKQILLHGELWAGKTSFVKERVKQLWSSSIDVKSPTYTYMNIYNNSFLHIDMWRIEEFENLHELWLLDALDTYEYSAIERPKREKHRSHPDAVTVRIEKTETWRVLILQD